MTTLSRHRQVLEVEGELVFVERRVEGLGADLRDGRVEGVTRRWRHASTLIRDAAAYGAVPEDAGGAPGRRDGLLQRTEVAAARAGGGPQHVRGLAPVGRDVWTLT